MNRTDRFKAHSDAGTLDAFVVELGEPLRFDEKDDPIGSLRRQVFALDLAIATLVGKWLVKPPRPSLQPGVDAAISTLGHFADKLEQLLREKGSSLR